MTSFMPFYYDNTAFITNQKCFIITGVFIEYLTAVFSSPLFSFCFGDCFPTLGEKGRELSKIFFDKIPILKVSEEQNDMFKELVEDIQSEYSEEKYNCINHLIYQLYNLTSEEIAIIEQ